MPNDEERDTASVSKGSPNRPDIENELRASGATFQNRENGAASSSNTGICRMHDIGVASSHGIRRFSGSAIPESIGPNLPRMRAALAAPLNGAWTVTSDPPLLMPSA